LWVLHHCDNPPCVRPDHLFLGTHADNMRDMTAKRREARGERHGSRVRPERILRGEQLPHTRLTAEDVAAIHVRLRAGERQRAVAAEFGVTQSLISLIVQRKVWAHLDAEALIERISPNGTGGTHA
jgi:hypothetical protein